VTGFESGAGVLQDIHGACSGMNLIEYQWQQLDAGQGEMLLGNHPAFCVG
jgi:hypothetical protein